MTCGQCGGTLEIDGSTRKVGCSFCGADVFIPDDVWVRLHPASTARRWFVLTGGAPGAPVGKETWFGVKEARADASGTVYCLGSWGGEMALWAVGPSDLRIKWLQRGLGFEPPARLTLTAYGQLLIWSDRECSTSAFNCADGTPAGTLGEQEPGDATVHALDFVGLESFCACPDGTFVALFKERLLRFSRDGRGLHTWPVETGLFSFLKKAPRPASLWQPSTSMPNDQLDKHDWDGARQRIARPARKVLGFNWMSFDIEKVGDRPMAFGWSSHPRLGTGPDGSIFVLAEGERHGLHLLRFDRRGKRQYTAQLPLDDVEHAFSPLGTADGSAYVLGEQNHEFKAVVRVSPDGRQVTEVARDKQVGGLLIEDDECLAVAPDGRFYVAGDDGSLIALQPDGQVIAMTDDARRQRG